MCGAFLQGPRKSAGVIKLAHSAGIKQCKYMVFTHQELTLQWKIHRLKMYFLLKMKLGIFQCHVFGSVFEGFLFNSV